MAEISATVKWEVYSNSERGERGGKGGGETEEEEALSLCDLPLSLVEEGSPPPPPSQPKKQTLHEEEEAEFDFGFSSLSGASSLSSSESNMCAADDVFFRGRILPLRRLSSAGSDSARPPSRSSSGAESMDRGSFSSGGLASGSARSHNSASRRSAAPGPRAINPFHSHPSPKPQIRIPPARAARTGRRATVWDMLRLGLARAPEIRLQDLKLRSNNSSRNSSANSSSSSSKNSNDNAKATSRGGVSDEDGYSSRRKSFDYGFLSGCKCSTSEVEVPSRSRRISGKPSMKSRAKAMEGEKAEDDDEGKEVEKTTNEGRESMTRHRTFEWVKELSRLPFDDVSG